VSCLPECETCADSSTCLTCYLGDGLYNNRCGTCPVGTYLSNDRICEKCPKHCKSCANAQTCQSCNSGYGLYKNLCTLCPAGTYLTSDLICKEIGISETLKETLSNSQLANSGVTQAANMVSGGSSLSLSAMVAGKIFSLIKHLNISYSGELQEALLTWKSSFVSLGLTPDLPESFINKIPERPVPYVFEKYEVLSSFLVNFWENLGIIIFGTMLWLLFKGIKLIISPKEKPRTTALIQKAHAMIQNFTLAALYGVYGDLILYAIIEYRTFVFGWNLSMLSLITSIILLFIMVLTFFYQIKILLFYQKIKKSSPNDSKPLEKFKKKHEGSQLFFNDFKDYSYSPQLFPLFLTGRDMLFSLILTTMFEYPLAQTIMITILGCMMIVYLLIKRPFENTFEFAQQLFFEFVGLVVNISCFVNAIFDSGDYQAIKGRNYIGKLVIIVNITFNFVTAVFMVILIGQTLIEFYKERKQNRVKKLTNLGIRHRIQASNSIMVTSSQVTTTQNKKTADLDNQSLLQSSIISSASNQLETISFQPERFDTNPLSNSQRRLKMKRPFRLNHQPKSSSFVINPQFHNPSLQTNETPLQGNQQEIQLKKAGRPRVVRRQDNETDQDLEISDVISLPETRPRR